MCFCNFCKFLYVFVGFNKVLVGCGLLINICQNTAVHSKIDDFWTATGGSGIFFHAQIVAALIQRNPSEIAGVGFYARTKFGRGGGFGGPGGGFFSTGSSSALRYFYLY